MPLPSKRSERIPAIAASVTAPQLAAPVTRTIRSRTCGVRSQTPPSTVKDTVVSANNPPGSVAVTVSVAEPATQLDAYTMSPATATVATVVFELEAVYVKESPSGSLKYGDTSTVAASPTRTVRAGIVPTRCGARFGTMT